MAFQARLKKFPTTDEIVAIGLSDNLGRSLEILAEVFDGTWKDCDIDHDQKGNYLVWIDEYCFPAEWCHIMQLEAE